MGVTVASDPHGHDRTCSTKPAAAHVRHHQPPRRGQDHAHREVPAVLRRGAGSRCGARPRGPPQLAQRLDGDSSSSAASPSAPPCSSSRITGTPSTCSTRPGHRDFSEDTYRVLAAVDAVVMVLDAAKGIESQTLKLFQVCRSRNLPVHHVPQQVRPTRPRAARAARRDRGADQPAPHPGHLAGGQRRRVPRRGRPPHRHVHQVHPHGPRRLGGAARKTSPLADAADRRRPRVAARDRRARPARGGRRRPRPAVVPGRRVHPAVHRLGAHQLRRAQAARRRGRTGAPALAAHRSWPATRTRWRRRSARSCSRCRPTWIRRTATASRSLASARALRARHERHQLAHRPRHDHQVRHHRVRRRSRDGRRSPSPATSSVWSTPAACSSATRCSMPATTAGAVEFPPLPRFAPEVFARARPMDNSKVEAVPQGPRAARRGGRRAGAARPRDGRHRERARRRRSTAVRGVRLPTGQRVRCTHRDRVGPVPGHPPHRQGSRPTACARSAASASSPAATAHSWPCSRTSTACSA